MTRNKLLAKLKERRKKLEQKIISTLFGAKTIQKAMSMVEAVRGKSKVSQGQITDPKFSNWKINEHGGMITCMSQDAIEMLKIGIHSSLNCKIETRSSQIQWEDGLDAIPFFQNNMKETEDLALLHTDIKRKMKQFGNQKIEFTYQVPDKDTYSSLQMHGDNISDEARIYGLNSEIYDKGTGKWVNNKPTPTLPLVEPKDVRCIVQTSKLKNALKKLKNAYDFAFEFRMHSYKDDLKSTDTEQITLFLTKLGEDDILVSEKVPADYSYVGYPNKGGLTTLQIDRLYNFLNTVNGECVIAFEKDYPIRITGCISNTSEPIYYEYVLCHKTDN